MAEFLLDPEVTFLNHGSFGAAPRPVLDAQQRWRDQMERQPVHFMVRALPLALEEARAAAAAFVGARPEDLTFVRNATAGVNAVVSSLRFAPGDQILTTAHRYLAVGNTLAHAAARAGAEVVTAPAPFPLRGAEDILDAVAAAFTPRTRLVVLDQISSLTALRFPVKRLVALARAHGALVLVDGAHAPGHLELDVASLGADFWVGNLHKWPCAPKGCALLWAAPPHQPALHPTVISNFYGQGWAKEFAWCGTDDPSPWLAAPAAIQVHEQLGGAAFRAANLALAAEARALLLERLDLEPPHDDPELTCAMASFLLPISAEDGPALYAGLQQRGIECMVERWQGRALMRISAFSAYNHIEQYERLAEAVRDLLPRR